MQIYEDKDILHLCETAERIAVPAHIRNETALWRGVIVQALMDAANNSRKREAVYCRHAAREWLTGGSRDFIMVCDYAAMDPGFVRRMAKRALLAGCKWRSAPSGGRRRDRERHPEPVMEDEPCPALVLEFPLRRLA